MPNETPMTRDARVVVIEKHAIIDGIERARGDLICAVHHLEIVRDRLQVVMHYDFSDEVREFKEFIHELIMASDRMLLDARLPDAIIAFRGAESKLT